MEIHKDFLMYFHREGVLNELKIVGSRYKNEINAFVMEGIFIPPLRFVLKVDLLRVQEISHKLYGLFITKPMKCVEIAEDISYHALKEFLHLTNFARSDTHITVHVTSFPGTLAWRFYHEPFQGLKMFSGILMGRTAPQKYIRSRVYFCNNSKCPNSRGRRFRRPFNNICSICSSQMAEDVRSLDIGEEITSHIIATNSFNDNGRFQYIKIILRDEICTSLNIQLGLEYNFIVNYGNNEFVVWHVSNRSTRIEILSTLGKLHDLPIPSSICDLYYKTSEYCQGSAWAFFGALSATLGSDSIPFSSFLQLKMGLMLSLASQNSDSIPVPLVAVGADISAVQKLIRSAGRLAERFINYTAGFAQLGGDKRHNIRNEIWYEAGAMILSRSGVCNLGDWSKFRKDQCNYICQTIESEKIILTSNERHKTEAEFVPLKCAVWTYWCHITTSNQDQLQLRTLIDVFGVPFLADENKESEIVKLTQKILKISMNDTKEETVIPFEDFKEYISLVNSRRLTLSDSATKLIHDFFVIIRKDRPECLPVGAIKTITSLAEAHARLSLRNEITYEDVIGVFYLYNEAISTLSGCPLIISSVPDSDISEPICRLIHNKIENFRNSLEEFLGKYLLL